MKSRKIIQQTKVLLTSAALAFVFLGSAVAAPISTGGNPGNDGFLLVDPDEYGGWASVTFGGNGDLFNPFGLPDVQEATFSSALYLIVPGRSQRAILTGNATLIGATGSDGSLTLGINQPLFASNTNGNGANDTLTSSFSATGTDTILQFNLTQTVVAGAPGTGVVQQDYVITNNAALAVDFNLVRVHDADMFWDGDFSNDQVGTNFHADGGDLYMYHEEVANPGPTSITMTSPQASSYYGLKQAVTPGLGAPAYTFGTDVTVFNTPGIPTSWTNNIAGVGYDIDGATGSVVASLGFATDAAMGLGVSASLQPGQSTTVTFRYIYGQQGLTPVEPVSIPTLNRFGLLALMAALALAGGLLIRRMV